MSGLRVVPVSRLPLGTRLLAMGDSGADVKELQQLLAAEGFYPNPPDGIFGVVTDEAVRQSQAANRLYADGIAGPLVLAALRNRLSSSRPIHRVSSEPDLPAVARKLGMSVAAVARPNHLSERARIYPGQRLLVNRHVLGLWADGPGRPATVALPPLSFMAYSAADLTSGGRLEPRLSQACGWVQARSIQSWPVILAEPGAWERVLKRPERWSGLWSEIRDLAGNERAVVDVGSPGISQRRRILRMLKRCVRPWRLTHGRLVLLYRLKAGGRIPAAWLKGIAAEVDGVILQVDEGFHSPERLRSLLRPILPAPPSARFMLGLSLTAREEVLDDAGQVIETLAVPYCEAQRRGFQTNGTPQTGPVQATYRFKGRWRRLMFVNATAITALCELVNSTGIEGIVFRGLEAGDARLYRMLPDCFGVTELRVGGS